jgi:hypothetical protein
MMDWVVQQRADFYFTQTSQIQIKCSLFTGSKMTAKSSLCITILCALSLVNAGCEFHPDSQFIIISGPVQIAANVTVVIKSPELMRTKYSRNMLCLQPGSPNKVPEVTSDKFGILSSDGKSFTPHVLLRDSKGAEDVLEPEGLSGMAFCYTPKWRQWQQKVLHEPYTTVLITSPSDLQLDQVTWFSGDK